jgi:hypothetical protein
MHASKDSMWYVEEKIFWIEMENEQDLSTIIVEREMPFISWVRQQYSRYDNTTFVLFGKYCPIMDQLGSKDSSRDFQLNCVISYFLPTFTTLYMDPKIDVMERVKKCQLLECI